MRALTTPADPQFIYPDNSFKNYKFPILSINIILTLYNLSQVEGKIITSEALIDAIAKQIKGQAMPSPIKQHLSTNDYCYFPYIIIQLYMMIQTTPPLSPMIHGHARKIVDIFKKRPSAQFNSSSSYLANKIITMHNYFNDCFSILGILEPFLASQENPDCLDQVCDQISSAYDSFNHRRFKCTITTLNRSLFLQHFVDDTEGTSEYSSEDSEDDQLILKM